MEVRPVDELDMRRGIRAAMLVASSLVYDEPEEDAARYYVESRVFDDAPFETSDEALVRGLSMLGDWCRSVDDDGLLEAVGALKREHLRLFVGCGAPLVPSWATYYSDPNQQILGQETLEVRAAYREFGLRIERIKSEPDDHLGLMMRFLAHLLGMECEALERGDAENAGHLRGKQRDFLVGHVLPWLPAWAFFGRKATTSDYYRGCVELVFGLVREYAGLFGISYREDPPSFVLRRE